MLIFIILYIAKKTNALLSSMTTSRRFNLLSIGLAIGIACAFIIPRSASYFSQDRSTAQQLQDDLSRHETAVSSTLLDRQFFQNLLDVIQNQAPVTNDIVDKMNAYAGMPFTIYVYKQDSLLFWSKPGLIIDPQYFDGKSPPLVARDHLDDFLIKEYTIYHDFTSYTVYAKIPLLHTNIDRSLLSIVSDSIQISRTAKWQVLQTLEGETIAAVDFATEKLGTAQQIALLLVCLFTGLLFILWVPATVSRFIPRTRITSPVLMILTIFAIRFAAMLTGYHETFDDLSIFTPINSGAIPYSLADLLIDSILFCTITLLAARLKPTTVNKDAGIIERNVITVGSYLAMILGIGLFAWVQRWLIMDTTLPINLDQTNFVSLNNAFVYTALAAMVFGLFLQGHRLLRALPSIQPSIYRRTGALVVAGLLSVAFITYVDLGIPLFGFYLAVLSTLVLFDLYVEANTRSVIWLICWSMLIAGFEASLLHNYRSNKDVSNRYTLAQQLSVDLVDDEDQDIDDVVLRWLPNIPGQYSLGVFKDEKLAYSYNYAYPLLQPQLQDEGPMYVVSDPERSEVGYRNGSYTVIVGKRNAGLMQIVSLFSYIFALFNVILFFIALSNSFLHYLPSELNISFSSRPTLRNRIQVAIVFLIILSFVIIGFVTVYYLRNTSEDRDKKYFEDRLRAVATSVAQAIPSADSLARSNELVNRIAGVAYVYNRRAKIFYDDGNLILQSDDLSTDKRPSIKMSFVNKFEMDQSDLTYSVQTIQTPKGPNYQGLLSLRDRHGKKYGYIEFPGTGMSQAEPENGSRFLGTLLNAYVFLFLIAVALAIGVANSITRPLAQLGDKLKQIKLGKKNEEIAWAIDDEIGALINDYNLMIQKIDESAQLLALTERDTAWREMAKQVAHEIKNPLTPMKLSIQYLQNGVNSDPERMKPLVERVCQTLIEQIDNLSKIASEFSSFAKMPQADNAKVLLNEIVASVHDLFRKRDDMDVQLYVPIQDIFVFADRTQLVRVLNNVVKNAIQAVPDNKRGQINISLVKKDDNAVIKVEDNGSGISQEMRDKVFRPNFTTKSSGTGLGLAICANIIESFNGRIYFETEEGKGTRFYIEIPLMKFDDNIKEEERVVL